MLFFVDLRAAHTLRTLVEPERWGRWRRRWLFAGCAIIAAAIVVTGWVAFSNGWRSAVGRYAAKRIQLINGHLADAPLGYVLLAGDSHAELASPAIRLCGAELVNAGISGVRAAFYADDVLPRLVFATRARAAVVLIGTNDIQLKDSPGGPGQLNQFEAAVGRIVRQLQARADLVIVTALPPFSSDERSIDAGAAVAYSERLASLCQHASCIFADPFTDIRDGTSGLAKPAVPHEGTHLRSYRAALRSLEGRLCRLPAAAASPG